MIVSLALIFGLGQITILSIFVLNITTLFGLGLGVDYSLFIVSRFREELTRGRNVEEAIAIANATPYGLNAGVYTDSLAEAFQCAREIVAGSVMINDAPSFRSDLMPYGGLKESGLGKEGPRYAVEEMTELKMVVIHQK